MTGFFRFADLNGDGTGAVDMSVNGGGTAQVFKLAPRAGERKLMIAQAILYVQDGGTWTASKFGSETALTTGIDFGLFDAETDEEYLDLMDGVFVSRNGGWPRTFYDVRVDSLGSGETYLSGRWTFSLAGEPLVIGTDSYFGVVIADDLTGITEMTVQLQGVVIN